MDTAPPAIDPPPERPVGLSIPQMAQMSRLLDEALPLNDAGRRAWLKALAPEYEAIAPALRDALLPSEAHSVAISALTTLPKLGSADDARGVGASGLQPGARVGPYELLRALGAGGMAEVWLARRADGAFKREVALKLPMLTGQRADLEQRFVRERDILASLEHPQIARLYDAGVSAEGLPYLAMEYVLGQPVTEWCDAHGLGIAARLQLFLQILQAVHYAHEKQVIHRDLKPSNILVSRSGQVRLLDFGVAKLLQVDESDQTPLTSVYGRALTPDYASPELLRGDPVDARSDLYSLGVLLYELLTGTRPYRLKNAASIGLVEAAIAQLEVKKPSTQLKQHVESSGGTAQPQRARQLRGDLDAMVLKALAKEPAERYSSAADMAEDLQRYLAGQPIRAQHAGFTYRARKLLLRNRGLATVSAIALAVIIATIGYALHRDRVAHASVAAPITTSAMKPVSNTSIAVLPFLDLSEKKDQEYFSDGLSDELIELLGETPELQVIARTSSFYFKGKSEKLETIAAELRVANILEGSVRRSGDKLRVTAQLIRVGTGEHLWSETFDRDLHDVFEVQDEIASAVVAALKVHLLSTQKPAARDELRTENIEAYNQYLRGMEAYNAGDSSGYQRAVTAFSAATALDPRYAAAYARLALARFWQADATSDLAGYNGALAAADKAVALAPEMAAGYAARGFLRAVFQFDFAGAQADLDTAVALSPGDADVLHRSAIVLVILGQLSAAIAREQAALALDPLSAEINMRLAFFYVANQQFAEARSLYNKALTIAPKSIRAWYNLGSLDLIENRPQQALADFRQSALPSFSLIGQVEAQYALGHYDESRRILERLIANDGEGNWWGIAEIYALRGDADQAFQWAERAYEHRDAGMTWIKIDPDFRPLRADPRYQALLRKMNLPQ
jgi:serine/threonine protein kinase/tetratricopeptide (TPR) repeat protein